VGLTVAVMVFVTVIVGVVVAVAVFVPVSVTVAVSVLVSVPVGRGVDVSSIKAGGTLMVVWVGMSVAVGTAVSIACAEAICVGDRASVAGIKAIISMSRNIFGYFKRIFEFIYPSMNKPVCVEVRSVLVFPSFFILALVFNFVVNLPVCFPPSTWTPPVHGLNL